MYTQTIHFFLCVVCYQQDYPFIPPKKVWGIFCMLGYEFQQISLTFKWELRLISPARLKIEISRHRRTITGSCFPGVPCQPSCRVSALFTQFLLKCSAPKSSTQCTPTAFYSFNYICSVLGWCQYTTADHRAELWILLKIIQVKFIQYGSLPEYRGKTTQTKWM